MSYCRTFKPTEEAILKLKKDRTYEDDLNLYKNVIICKCMLEHPIENIYTLNSRLMYLLNIIKSFVKNDIENGIYLNYETSDNKTFSFCGWQYSHDSCDMEEKDVFNNTLSKLLTLAVVVQTPDYFTNCDAFYDKYNAIAEKIDVFIDNYATIVTFDIIDRFKEFDITDKEENENDEFE